MNAVGLSYKGQAVYLDPDFSIDWEVEDDIFDFDSLGHAYSWTVNIPIKGNEHIFKFASDPSRTKNYFKTFDDFAVTLDGNIWWECSFELKSISRSGQYYQGTLNNILSPIIINKDKNIKEYLTKSFTLVYGDPVSQLDYDTDGVCFPELSFKNDFWSASVPINGTNAARLPVFNLKKLIQWVLDEFDYQLIDRYSVLGDYLADLCVFHNRIMENAQFSYAGLGYVWTIINNELVVKDYLPDITLAQLLKDLAFYTGSVIRIEGDQVIVESIKRSITNQNIITDLSDKTTYQYIKSPEIRNIQISIDHDEDLDKGTPTGNYIGEYDDAATFEADTAYDDRENYAFCLLENAYYQWKYEAGETVLKRISAPIDDYSSGNQNAYQFIPNFTPVSKDRYHYYEQSGSFSISDNGSGKVRISGFSNSLELGGTTGDIAFKVSNEDVLYPTYFVSVTSVNYGSLYMDIDMDYDDDVTIRSLTRRYEYDYYVPYINNSLQNPINGVGFTDTTDNFAGRICFYYGLQNDIAASATYRYAAADPYASDGTKIGTYALNTAQSNNFITALYGKVISFLEDAKFVGLIGDVSPKDVQNIFKNGLIRYQKGLLKFRRFRCTLTQNGIRNQELEGYTL